MSEEQLEEILNELIPPDITSKENKDVCDKLKYFYNKAIIKSTIRQVKNSSFFKYNCRDSQELTYYEVTGCIPHNFTHRINKDLDHCTCDDFITNTQGNLVFVYKCEHTLALKLVKILHEKGLLESLLDPNENQEETNQIHYKNAYRITYFESDISQFEAMQRSQEYGRKMIM